MFSITSLLSLGKQAFDISSLICPLKVSETAQAIPLVKRVVPEIDDMNLSWEEEHDGPDLPWNKLIILSVAEIYLQMVITFF